MAMLEPSKNFQHFLQLYKPYIFSGLPPPLKMNNWAQMCMKFTYSLSQTLTPSQKYIYVFYTYENIDIFGLTTPNFY